MTSVWSAPPTAKALWFGPRSPLAAYLIREAGGLRQGRRHAERDDSPRPQQGFHYSLVRFRRNAKQPHAHPSSSPTSPTKPAVSTPPVRSPPPSIARAPKAARQFRTIPLTAALDVIGQNEYIGWYRGAPEDADNMHWTLPNKPVIMSEFGAGAKQGNHGTNNDR